MVRQGVMENLPKTPFAMGFECSGEVEALGENVDNFAVSGLIWVIISIYPNWPVQLIKLSRNVTWMKGSKLNFVHTSPNLARYLLPILL